MSMDTGYTVRQRRRMRQRMNKSGRAEWVYVADTCDGCTCDALAIGVSAWTAALAATLGQTVMLIGDK